MIHHLPNSKVPLCTGHFVPGFKFELQTGTDPEKWERITIHQNCAPELIAELRRIFRRDPAMFRMC